MKTCSKCKITKSLKEFHKHKGHSLDVMNSCKDCRNLHVVSKRHGLTINELQNLFKIQDNKCYICNIDKNEVKKGLAVDHCHKTGKIRGLLCTNCNNGLGRFKDNIELLEKAIVYLKENL